METNPHHREYEALIAERMWAIDEHCSDEQLDALRRQAIQSLIDGTDDDGEYMAYLRSCLS